MNFPGPVFCSSYHEFVQSNGRVRGYKRRDLRSSSRKGGTRPKSVFPCREICQVWTQKGRPKKRDFLSSSKWGLAYLTYNEVVWPKVDEKISVAAMVDGFSGGISHKSRFVDRSNIPRKIGRPQFNGADKRVQTSGGLKNIRKEVKKSGVAQWEKLLQIVSLSLLYTSEASNIHNAWKYSKCHIRILAFFTILSY